MTHGYSKIRLLNKSLFYHSLSVKNGTFRHYCLYMLIMTKKIISFLEKYYA